MREQSFRIKILSFAPARNRQGTDLAGTLADCGHLVELYQLDDGSTLEATSNHYRCIPIKSSSLQVRNSLLFRMPGLKGGVLSTAFLHKALWGHCDIVVAINYRSLLIAYIIARLNNARLVYYPLETVSGKQQKWERRFCASHCKYLIGVEPNRVESLVANLKKEIPHLVVPNAPRKGIGMEPHGKLRSYLRDKHGLTPEEQIILYHGSYQNYSRLEDIVRGTNCWDHRLKLAIMITGDIPSSFLKLLQAFQHRVFLVPAISHTELYAWVRDATVGLLPYEDEINFNVRYCSPQKLFDYLACGVPFIGSPRPLIKEVAEQSGAGCCVDVRDPLALSDTLHRLTLNRVNLSTFSAKARIAYETRYHYEKLVSPFIQWLQE